MSYRYEVEVPPASAARLECKRLLRVTSHQGWGPGIDVLRSEIPAGEKSISFELEKPLEPRNPAVFDGHYDLVTIEYSNESGSRTDKKEVTPTLAEEPTK